MALQAVEEGQRNAGSASSRNTALGRERGGIDGWPPMFSLEEAERLLPQLENWLRTAITSKKKIAEIEMEFAELVRLVTTTGGRIVDVSHWLRRKQEEESSGEILRDSAQKIEDAGVLIKNLDIGLIDFPCEMDGREVYLCWKLGEPSIAFWHNTNEGFSGRKPLDRGGTEPSDRLRPI